LVDTILMVFYLVKEFQQIAILDIVAFAQCAT
jgi:hypothetical protein